MTIGNSARRSTPALPCSAKQLPNPAGDVFCLKPLLRFPHTRRLGLLLLALLGLLWARPARA